MGIWRSQVMSIILWFTSSESVSYSVQIFELSGSLGSEWEVRVLNVGGIDQLLGTAWGCFFICNLGMILHRMFMKIKTYRALHIKLLFVLLCLASGGKVGVHQIFPGISLSSVRLFHCLILICWFKSHFHL